MSDRKKILSWCMYDWANSGFATTILAAVMPIFYVKVAGANLAPVQATSNWGFTNSIAMLTAAILAPILGAMADHSGSRKRFLALFMGVGSLGTASLVVISTGDWLLASGLYLIGRIGFSASNIFYDSLLPSVAGDRIDQVSTGGYAIGYLGGGILLAINLLMIQKPALFGIHEYMGVSAVEWGTRLSFVTVGLWWALFSIPVLKNVPEPPSIKMAGEYKSSIAASFQRIGLTFSEIKKFREALKFLIAYWLYNDGIGTIIVMATAFGTEIGIGQGHLIGALLMVQFAGIPFTLLFGTIAKKLSPKTGILISLTIYSAISIGGYFMSSPIHFWILAFCVALVQGGSQGLSRSLFGAMIPRSKTAEFFGFYDISSKFSGVLGPLVFGLVGTLTGTSRLSILAVVFFFITGGFLLLFVDHEKGKALAREAEAKIEGMA
ncbi:MAG: MFS transporter [Deltaproteobacteria bacterium]|uniref:MFS transporter n=1 Tax=Candidatus Zymogenus saltonus TaxID=2844893 RepID=A0A9D8KCK1_9DELT|nr:MFS transporter [Candidatus Zymogenus saltonus]